MIYLVSPQAKISGWSTWKQSKGLNDENNKIEQIVK